MSKNIGGKIHIETEDASGGTKSNVARYVLAISLFAAIALLSAIWIFGALSNGGADESSAGTGATNVLIPEDGRTAPEVTGPEMGTSGPEVTATEAAEAGAAGPDALN